MRVVLWGGSRFGAAGDDLRRLFWRIEDLGINLQEWYMRIIYALRIEVYRCFSAVKLVYKGHIIKDGSRLSEQWGEQMSVSVMERKV